jgi:hypothetical protein
MSTKPPVLAQVYAPYADRAGPQASPRSPEWLHWVAFLIFFLSRPLGAIRMLRSGRLTSWWHDRPDLPAGSAEGYFASVRGPFGNSIRWRCIRHGIGPGHPDWPMLSRAIVAFGGSLDGFRVGAPPRGLLWWENPGVIPGVVTGFSAPSAATVALRKQLSAAEFSPLLPNVPQAEAAHGRLPASWLSASRQHVFARAGPGSSTGPPYCPGLPRSVMCDARGRSTASPAVLIRADRKSRARPGTAHAFGPFGTMTFPMPWTIEAASTARVRTVPRPSDGDWDAGTSRNTPQNRVQSTRPGDAPHPGDAGDLYGRPDLPTPGSIVPWCHCELTTGRRRPRPE